MTLSFFGAAREVTGSCHCLEVNNKKILVDCGLIQGKDDDIRNQSFAFEASSIDYVIVTHAHIDHSGRLPLLVKNGFKGKIFCTGATSKLLSIMLLDCAHIQEVETKWKNQKSKRSDSPIEEPIYTISDAENTLEYLVNCSYNEDVIIDKDINLKFIDAGHLLGSAYAEVNVTENGVSKKIVFSGDIGNTGQPIIKDPSYITSADYVVMESTYGDRNHGPTHDYISELAKIIENTLIRGGNVVLPSFAVGRTQELLYSIREMKKQGLVKKIPNFPVYVDSPLALEATNIYDGDLTGYADEETIAILNKGFEPIKFSNLHLCKSVDESKFLNEDITAKVIISSSGMCEAGRIRHHLKHNLWRKECSIVFVGFQAAGTLGRLLIDGIKRVKLFGEEIAIKATIYNFQGLSSHADKTGLVKWISALENKPQKVFIVHGEDSVCDAFSNTLSDLGFDTFVPNFQTKYDLCTDSIISIGVNKEELETHYVQNDISTMYVKLLAEGEQLLDVIRQNEGLSNKNLSKFRDQIRALSKKWDR